MVEETKRETEISKVIGRLDSVIAKVGGNTEQLGIRLCNIMLGGLDEPEKPLAGALEFSVPLAQELNKFVCRLEKVANELNQLANRVQL